MEANIKKFYSIRKLLIETRNIWDEEIIFSYPECFQYFPIDWVLELNLSSKEKLFHFASYGNDDVIINKSFRDFLFRIKHLSEVPKISIKEQELKAPFLKIKGKKNHEIKSIYQFLSKKSDFNLIIDHCGGKGHLSHLLHQYFSNDKCLIEGPDFLCLDFNEKLLASGEKKYSQYQHSVFYSHKDLFKSNPPNYLKNRSKTLSLGLHTCGALSIKQIEWAKELEIPSILNFGCCYSKLYDEGGVNLSKIAQFPQQEVLNFGQAGLTLATHAYHPMTPREFEMKYAVKFYRYGLFIFLHQYFPEFKFHTIGNSPPSLYQKKFSEYAMVHLIKLGVKNITPKTLDSFFKNSKIKYEIISMINMGLIRGTLGRLIEIYLLLDRLFYLEESSYQTDLLTFFDSTISPRNTGIWATKKVQ